MTVIPVQVRTTGFSAAMDEHRKIPVSSSHNIEPIRRVYDITVNRAYVVTGHLSTIVFLDTVNKSIASGFTRLSIKMYRIAIGATIPDNLETLEPSFASERQYPYESNLYTGKVDEIISIPMVSGRYIVEVKISGSVIIPPQPSQQHLNVFDRIDLSGVPSTGEEQYLESIVLSLNDVMDSLTTEVTTLQDILADQLGDNTAIASILTKLDAINANLA